MWRRWQRWRYLRLLLVCGATLAALALCANLAYQSGMIGTIAYRHYLNTSLPSLTTQEGVTLEVEHSRYVTLESIALTLVNGSRAPIYLPTLTTRWYPPGVPALMYLAQGDGCLAIETDTQRAHGWQALGRGCDWSNWGCGDAAPPILHPAVLIIKPGEAARFSLYDGQDMYPPWSSGVYRFSVLYSPTLFSAPRAWSSPLVIPHGVTQWSAPVTLTAAWGYPASYHQTPPRCPSVG